MKNYLEMDLDELELEISFQKKLISATEKHIQVPMMEEQSKRLKAELEILEARFSDLEKEEIAKDLILDDKNLDTTH